MEVGELALNHAPPEGVEPNLSAGAPVGSLAPRRKYGVLVADDEVLLGGMLALGLGQHGFSVWLASNGQEAIDLYRVHRELIHVALLDVRMPGRDGPQTLLAIREVHPRVPCCFMSGDLGSHSEESLRGMGASVVFRKPFLLAEVAAVLLRLARDCPLAPRGA
jgi:DNA-binding response OmpR family regulator